MNLRRHQLVVLCAAALAAHACGNSASTSMNVTAPAGARCQATVSHNAPSFTPAGGTGTVTVTVARECPWNAVSQSPWLVITSGQEGQGDGTVTYRVAENDAPLTRQGTLVISERQVPVSQAAAPCQFEAWLEHDDPVPAGGGARQVELRTHELCNWSAAAEVPFALVMPQTGRGNASLQIQVQANSGTARTVSVVIANRRVALTQSAPSGPPPSPPAPTPPAPAPAPTPTPTPTPTPPPAPIPIPPGPTPVRTIELEGRSTSVAGACPALTFTLRGYTVYTTSETRFDDGRCQDIRNGREVEVRGMLMSDGRVRADRVEVDD